MIELELKALVPDLPALLERLERAGARPEFAGTLEDRRVDTTTAALTARDEVLRVRVYRSPTAPTTVSLDWKGPVSVVDGYKNREEVSVGAADPDALMAVLGKLGYRVSLAIDREIWQYELAGASVRVERYPHMDDLVEVEGEPAAIEAAIAALGLDRSTFTSENLPVFVRRFELRTGTAAVLARASIDAGPGAPPSAGSSHG